MATGIGDAGAERRRKTKGGRRYCCVYKCHNYVGMREDISFYVFPSKPYEQERRRRWIQAVRRADEDGQPWQPGPNSRICSRHFVGNKMSNIMHHPAYVPTIFPSEYHRQAPSDASAPSERYERWAARHRSSADFSVGACQPTQLDKGEYMQPENDDKGKDVCSQSHSHLDPDKNEKCEPAVNSLNQEQSVYQVAPPSESVSLKLFSSHIAEVQVHTSLVSRAMALKKHFLNHWIRQLGNHARLTHRPCLLELCCRRDARSCFIAL
ncbi:uncharacterized protein LOC119461743 [Dermacentor silvarum]|uniref:uncharacterized protein LOC119461743 n=1 Tax=Dermacentor silvarum TaxID=543639 RepID=UPI002101A684|nr:uncharacterized protein LOC119461743 [Dermacentor silvarum]